MSIVERELSLESVDIDHDSREFRAVLVRMSSIAAGHVSAAACDLTLARVAPWLGRDLMERASRLLRDAEFFRKAVAEFVPPADSDVEAGF